MIFFPATVGQLRECLKDFGDDVLLGANEEGVMELAGAQFELVYVDPVTLKILGTEGNDDELRLEREGRLYTDAWCVDTPGDQPVGNEKVAP